MSVALIQEEPYAWLDRLEDDDLRGLHSAVLKAFYGRFRTNVGNPRAGSRAALLASMKVGESRLFGKIVPSRLTGHTRDCARKRMRNPEASWSCRSTTKGLRVTRVR